MKNRVKRITFAVYILVLCTSVLFGCAASNDPAVNEAVGTGLSTKWIIAIILVVVLISSVLAILLLRQRRGKGVVLGIAGEYKGARFVIGDGEVVIGHDPGLANIVLTDGIARISRSHCSVRYDRGKYIVIDHSSSGTFRKNGNRLAVGRDNVLRRGSLIYLGDIGSMFKLL